MKVPSYIVCQMIEPVFLSRLRYAMEVTVDGMVGDEHAGMKQLHGLHRQAMKAALGIPHLAHPSDQELLERTGQKPLSTVVLEATASLAWKCLTQEENPLMQDRLEGHYSGRNTRQSTMRNFPPQCTRGTLISRLVETWERLPENVKRTTDWSKAQKSIKEWASKRGLK